MARIYLNRPYLICDYDEDDTNDVDNDDYNDDG
jgi:hypothetical protein